MLTANSPLLYSRNTGGQLSKVQIRLPRRESEELELNYETAYVIVYMLVAALGSAHTIWHELTQVHAINPSYTVDGIIAGMHRAATAAVPVTVALVEIGGRIVVLANRSIKKALSRGREEGLEEGRAEGEKAANNRWITWNRRRQRAEANGDPFDEPPPAC